MGYGWSRLNVQFSTFSQDQFAAVTSNLPARAGAMQRICHAIRNQITSGALAPGAPVPSTRALAVEWGVSRTTVTAAYEQLIAEGYLEARQGTATRVAPGLAASPPPSAQPPPGGAADELSASGRRLADFVLPPERSREGLAIDFRYGDLAGADFPRVAWRKVVTAALLRTQPRLRYGDPSGSQRLRTALQGYLWRARGLRCEPDQVIVVNGSQQGIDLCARLLLDPGDGVLMENPGYNLARQVFRAAGASVIPVPVDAEGMRTERLPEARLAYTTPSHQFPLGGIMAAARRRDLLAWAERSGAHVIEDDYDSEYRYDIAPVPTLQALDEAGRVIYLGTVSKTLSPTLRLGYLVVPQVLAPAFATAKRLMDRHTPGLEQEALAELIESGAYERHVRRVRRRNGERRAALLTAFTETFGEEVAIVGAEAGLHIVVWLNNLPRAREEVLIARAHGAGIGVYPVSPLYASASTATELPSKVGLVMGYASLDEETIRRGVRSLKQVLDEVVPRPVFRAQ